MCKYIIFILFIIIAFVFICKLLYIEKFSNFNCDLIPNSDVCTIKIKGDDGEKGMKGSDGYKGIKGSKGENGLSGNTGINGKEIPNINFKEINNEGALLGNYYSYDDEAITRTININRGSKGIEVFIPPLKLIYNDSSKDRTINQTDKNSHMEPIEINLKNVKGIKGNRGVDGQCSDGEKGITGDPGRQGNPGLSGADGKDGPMGHDGDPGPTQQNAEYNNVQSKKYCFIKNENVPLCISTDSYIHYFDNIKIIDEYVLDTTDIIKNAPRSLQNEPSEDSEFNQQCIQCSCGKINNGSGECVDDDTNLVIFNKNNDCFSFLRRDLNLASMGENWNNKATRIFIPPDVKITAHLHDNELWYDCKEYNNTGDEIMKQILDDGISYIGYNKICDDFPRPEPVFGDRISVNFERDNEWGSPWRKNAWQIVGERYSDYKYIMIILDSKLYYCNYGDAKGRAEETEEIIVTSLKAPFKRKKFIRWDDKYEITRQAHYKQTAIKIRVSIAPSHDNIRVDYAETHKHNDYIREDRGFNFTDEDYWTEDGKSYSFHYQDEI